MKNKLFLLFFLGLGLGYAQEKENLWPLNGSFETSVEGFAAARDDAEAFDGKYSLKLSPSDQSAGRKVFLFSKPGIAHTLVFYAKSDRSCSLKAHTQDDRWNYNSHGTFPLEKQWKRCVLRLKPQNYVTSVRLCLNKTNHATVWIDAIGFYEGDAPASYRPGRSIEVGSLPRGTPSRILPPDKAPVHTAIATRNNTDLPVDLEISGTVENASTRKTERIFQKKITLAPHALFEESVRVLNTAETGYYVLRSEAKQNEKTIASHAQPLMIQSSPRAPSDDAFFGIHFSDGIRGRDVGASWSRSFENPRQKTGNGYKINSNPALNLLEKYGMRQIRCINFSRWKTRTPAGKIPEIREWVLAMWNSFHGKFRYCELMNEPDLTFPNDPGGYADILNDVVPALRKSQPDVKILAAGVSGCDFNANFRFLEPVLKKAGKNIDVLPVHPYTLNHYIDASAADLSPERGNIASNTKKLRELLKRYELNPEIWFGEVGWALDVGEDYLSPSSRRFASYIPRLMLAGKIAGVKKIMYFLIDDCVERDRYYYGLWRGGQPLPAAAAYVASARILEGAELLDVVADCDFHCVTFRNADGRLFAALWLSNGLTTRIKIPAYAGPVESVRDLFGVEIGKSIEFDISGEPRYFYPRVQDRNALKKALMNADYELPPVSVRWELTSPDAVRAELTNLRSRTVSGKAVIRGAAFERPVRTFELRPGKSVRYRFTAGKALNDSELKLSVSSEFGNTESGYRTSLIPCPRFTPDWKSESPLPSIGRLPAMDSRNFLLPNDPTNGWDGPQNLSVESAVCHDRENLYLLADVRDDVHVQNRSPGRLWSQDSLQLSLDTRCNAVPDAGFDSDDYEFGFALSNGTFQKELTYTFDTGRAKTILEGVRGTVFRRNGKTCYRIAIPWKQIRITPDSNTVFGLNFTANDTDGTPQTRYFMGLTPGIVDSKNPSVFRKFYLEK